MSDFAWPLLASVLAAGAMYWRCIRPMRRSRTGRPAATPSEQEQLEALRREVAELRASAVRHDTPGHAQKESHQ